MIKFIIPTLEYVPSYIEALKISEEEGFPDFIGTSKEIEKNPKEFIEKVNLLDSKDCIKVKDYLLPSKLFWLVNVDTKEFIGRVSIRYNVNNPYLEIFGGHIGYMVNKKFRKKGFGFMLLEFGIKIAREISLGEILITCNENNLSSKKIIEKAGGKLINSIYDNNEKINKLRYRIILNESAHNMWQDFLKTTDDLRIKKKDFSYICWSFGTEPDELLSLVLLNKKTACTSLYSEEYLNIINPGTYNIILNSSEKAICIVKTINIQIENKTSENTPLILEEFKLVYSN